MKHKPINFIRDSGDSPAPIPARTPGPTLRSQLIETHGDIMGSVLFEAQMRVRRETAEKFQALKGKLDTLRVQLDEQTAAGDVRLAPLEAAMNRAHTAWMDAFAAYERQRLANQSAVFPLNNEIAALVGQINIPLHTNRVKQWVPAPENGGILNDGG